MNDEWVTVKEASDASGYTVEYVRSLARQGLIVSEKRGWQHFIRLDSILQYKAEKDEWREQRGGEG